MRSDLWDQELLLKKIKKSLFLKQKLFRFCFWDLRKGSQVAVPPIWAPPPQEQEATHAEAPAGKDIEGKIK